MASEKLIYSINPATEEILGSYRLHAEDEIEAKLQQAAKAYTGWRTHPLNKRAELMHEAARCLRRNKKKLAALITQEMGKPIVESEGEIEKCAGNCDYYGENTERFLQPERRASGAAESFLQYMPLGAILAIMPWNYPFWQVFRFAAPALMAGNTAVLKHASNVPQCALAIEEIFRDAGFPEGVFQSLFVPGTETARLIEHPVIAAVTLTGSEKAGSQTAACAGRMLKKTVLELGGSDPFIVLADADLDLTLKAGTMARFQNTGQSCIAAKRFIIVESVYNEFIDRFVTAVQALKAGDPMDASTHIGPLARAEFIEDIERQIRESVLQGAHIAAGGTRLNQKGYYFEPTVLTDVTPDMPAGSEELFGPVAAVMKAKNAEEAIELANRTPFGLGSSLWTADVDQAKQIACRIEAGQVFINGLVRSDPRLPFGGIKRSGYGRELSDFGIREFVNIQTVWIGPAVKP